jgi:antitoxin (DNA-binding transcriptional repressor) of toxin-antitoxin stability system
MPQLREITQHQLDADSLTILRHVEDGERFVVTRDGTPVAELAPVRRETPDVVTLFDGAAPPVSDRFFADLDAGTDERFPW